jgi:hypothetical protein
MFSISSIWGAIKEFVSSAFEWVQAAADITRMTGEPATQEQRQLFEEYKRVSEEGRHWSEYDPKEPLPEKVFTHVDWNFQKDFVYRVKMTVKYTNGAIESGLVKTLESNRRLSLNEIHMGLGDMFSKEDYEGMIQEYVLEDMELLAKPPEWW